MGSADTFPIRGRACHVVWGAAAVRQCVPRCGLRGGKLSAEAHGWAPKRQPRHVGTTLLTAVSRTRRDVNGPARRFYSRDSDIGAVTISRQTTSLPFVRKLLNLIAYLNMPIVLFDYANTGSHLICEEMNFYATVQRKCRIHMPNRIWLPHISLGVTQHIKID